MTFATWLITIVLLTFKRFSTCKKPEFQPGKYYYSIGRSNHFKLHDKLNYACFLIGSCLWPIRGKMHRWRRHNKFMLFLLYSTIDFILPWVCFAVTDHRRLQNVERSRSEIFQIFCCDHIFDVICDLLLDRRTETQNRYVTFTITGSKTGRQRHFFSETLFTSLFPLHRLFPLSNRRHRDQVGSIILPKDSDLSLSEREKGEKIMFLIMRDFTDFSLFSDTSVM